MRRHALTNGQKVIIIGTLLLALAAAVIISLNMTQPATPALDPMTAAFQYCMDTMTDAGDRSISVEYAGEQCSKWMHDDQDYFLDFWDPSRG